MKPLKINYNNQRVVVELVTYLDLCKDVSHVLGFEQWEEVSARSSLVGDWSEGLIVS